MHKLSLHFDWHEFACQGNDCCNHSHPVDKRLIDALESLRALAIDTHNNPNLHIIINSGFRCIRHNEQVHGKPNSLHTLGQAADIRIPGLSPLKIASLAKRIPIFRTGGVGVYDTFVHLDIRPDGPAEW